MTPHLPSLQPEKWRRYYFESKDRYYTIVLQQDLFHEWSIIKCYGGKDNKLGNMLIKSFSSYEKAMSKIEEIKKRRKARKYKLKKTKAPKLGLRF